MANIKFSGFTEVTNVSAVQEIVGYNGTQNVRITPANFVTTGGTGVFLPLAGGTMTGTTGVTMPDSFPLFLGSSGASDSKIFWDGDNIEIQARKASADIVFRAANSSGVLGEFLAIDGGVQKTRAYKDIHFQDNVKASFGDTISPDLQIYHDGSNSFISDTGTGSLFIQGSNLFLQSSVNKTAILCNDSDSVELYYDAVKKFETTSTGISVTTEIKAITNGTLFLDNTNNNNPYYLYNSGGNLASLQIGRGTSPGSNVAMAFDNSGNVGIGTTSPQQKLDTPNIIIGGSSIATSYRANALLMDNFGGAARFYSLGSDNSTGGSYQFNSLSANASAGSGTVMTINNNGKVGIGTTSPTDGLTISNDNNLLLGLNSPAGNDAQLRFYSSGNYKTIIYRPANSNDLRFNTVTSGDVLTLLQSGNVGIGTTTPTAKLQVVGLAEHADNAAAITAGLTTGAFYRTGDLLKVVH